MPAPSSRRDQRFRLRPGCAVEFPAPPISGHSTLADLVVVSVAGLGFRLAGNPDAVERGGSFDDIRVHVGGCSIAGKAVVRNVRSHAPGQIEVGCLFYPVCDDEDRWMTLIAGIAAASSDAEEQP